MQSFYTKHLFCLFCCLLFCLPARAQRENVWIFPTLNGLDFNSGAPVPFLSPLGYGLASASVCDASGQLLFFGNGNELWDRSFNRMPNGHGLVLPGPIGDPGPAMNAPQSILIVPMPDSTDKYYVLSMTHSQEYPEGRLSYSIVDMTLNGGLGDVVPGRKNMVIDTGFEGSCMNAVAGDDCNVWIITVPRRNEGEDNRFKVFEISPAGLSGTPVLSTTPGFSSTYLLKVDVSPTRKRLAFCGFALELYDFNPATGVISNPMRIDSNKVFDAPCFSPDGTKLYSINIVMPGMGSGSLEQFDVTGPTAAAISATRIVATPTAETSDMKRGPNGRVYYFVERLISILGCIRYPNLSCPGCSISNYNVPLAIGEDSSFGYTLGDFPNEVAVANPKDTVYYKSDTLLCLTDTLALQAPTGFNSYVWDNGSTDLVRRVTAAGTYRVYCRGYCRDRVDSITVLGRPKPRVALGNDTVLCTGERLTLFVDVPPGATVRWSTGSTAPHIDASEANMYWAAVTEPPCSSSDTVRVTVDDHCYCEPSLPSAFSPNGDGRNDVFLPLFRQDCTVTNFSLYIYNRFGQRVFSSADSRKGWNGQAGALPADIGVYFYTLSYEGGSKKKVYERKGDLSLVR